MRMRTMIGAMAGFALGMSASRYMKNIQGMTQGTTSNGTGMNNQAMYPTASTVGPNTSPITSTFTSSTVSPTAGVSVNNMLDQVENNGSGIQ